MSIQLRKELARKDKQCRFCQEELLTGQEIYIVSDTDKNSFELLCIPCGDKVAQRNDIREMLADVAADISKLQLKYSRLLNELEGKLK